MHSLERELRQLLATDQSSSELEPVAAHVEHCTVCQNRLAVLASDPHWSTAAIGHLRESSADDFEFESCQSSVNIEVQSGLAEGTQVEAETVDLGFLSPAVHPELLGRLGRYDIERVIGTGGMGVVLKAHDSELNRIVAVKVLAPHLANNSSARRRFAREVQAAAAVLHPNVLPIYNVESDGPLPYLVMHYVYGLSLQARVDRDGPLDIAVALRIAKQTAAGLAAAHQQGLVHRDVKPANILLEEEVERAQLSDFGLARTVDDASLTRTGIVAGTPHYMSPEQASGETIDARSDLFGLGSVLYFMLAGHPPFRAPSAMAVLNRICHHAHRPVHQINSRVPRELSQLVDRRLLAKSADRRFASALDVERALEGLLSALQKGRLRLANGRSRMRLLKFAAAVLTVGASAVGVIYVAAPASRLFQRIAYRSQSPQSIQPTESMAQSLSKEFPAVANSIPSPPYSDRMVEKFPQLLANPDDQWMRDTRNLEVELTQYEQTARIEFESMTLIESMEATWRNCAHEMEGELKQLEEDLGKP